MHPKATVAVVVVTAVAGLLLVRVPAVRPARFCRVRLAMARLAAERALAVGLPVRPEAVLDLAALPGLLNHRAGARRDQVSRGS